MQKSENGTCSAPLPEMIYEEFGDGIMSANNFDITMERQPDQKGNRVKLTMSGKFSPCKAVSRAKQA